MRWMREHKLISALILVLFLLLLIFAASVTAGGRFAHVTAPVNSGVSKISGFFSSAGSAIRDNVKGIFSYCSSRWKHSKMRTQSLRGSWQRRN